MLLRLPPNHPFYSVQGRWFIRQDDLPLTLACVAKYELTSSAKEENYGLTAGYVYKVLKGD